jgi:N6-adenosine-specific RNA methylase IME4
MKDYKSIVTPMVTNLKLLSDSSSDLVVPRMYRQLIGSLMYLVNTRRNICFAVNTLSQYMVEVRHVHWIKTKHVLRYIHGTIGYGLRYVSVGYVKLQDYTNSD